MTASTESAQKLLGEIAAAVEPWRQALAGEGAGDRHAQLLTALKTVLGSCPTPLDQNLSSPDAAGRTPEKAALHYRLANEAVRVFCNSGKRPDTLTRGTLLDIWSTWWSTANALPPRDAAQRIAELFPRNDDSLLLRRVVQPRLVLDALCRCDRDVWEVLAIGQRVKGQEGDDEDEGGEDELHKQIVWQMRRLHCAPDRFGVADRVVLYELLHMRHLHQADRDAGFSVETLTRLLEAAKETRQALTDKNGTIPWVSEVAFQIKTEARWDKEPSQEAMRDEWALAIAAMQFIFSAHFPAADYSERTPSIQALDEATKRAKVAAVKLSLEVEDTFETDLRRLLLRLAARSRMIRLALIDLRFYSFPLPAGRPEVKRDADDLCDCWISVVGYRTTGKSSFMASLTAALLPDDANLDQGAVVSSGFVDFWKKGRVRLFEASEFATASNRSEVEAKAFQTDDIQKILTTWCAQGNLERTPPDLKNIAEIDTAHMARLRFFDLAGEWIIDPDHKELGDEIAKALRAMKPAAAVIIDSDDEETNERHLTSNYGNFARLVADQDSPIYIVVNKFDDILKNGYDGEAFDEAKRSMSYEDKPIESDADFDQGWLPYFTLRDTHFSEQFFKSTAREKFDVVLDHLDTAPPFARRPYYQDRLREDLVRLRRLLEALLEAGRTDISLFYLTSARGELILKRHNDGKAEKVIVPRTNPKQFRGHQKLWDDIERRVLKATAKGRWAAIRQLLVLDPIAAEQKATEVYGNLNKIFKELVDDLHAAVNKTPTSSQNPERLSDEDLQEWYEFYDKIASYEAAARLRPAWDAAVYVLTARRNLIAGLEEAVGELLPEVGIDPRDRFDVHDFNTACRPLSEMQDQKVVRERIDTVPVELRREEVQRPDATATSNADRRVEVHYDLREGAQLPLRIPGAPAQDNLLNDLQRAALRNAQGEFGSAILDAKKPEEAGVTLARALRNISLDSQVSANDRYRFLRLQPGERDFHRVRVLSEESQLGAVLQEVSDATFEVMGEFLSARAGLSQVSETLLADWLMAEALVRALPMLAGTRIDELVGEEEESGTLKRLVDGANELKSEIQTVRAQKHWFWRDTNRLRWACAKAYQSNDILWKQMLPSSSEQAAQRRLHSQWMRTADKNELSAVPRRLSESIELLTTLHNSIKRLKNADKDSLTRLQTFLRQPAGTWPDALRPRLVRLRLMRRQLLLNYALSVLRAGGWIPPQKSVESDRPTPPLLVEANRRLKNAMDELAGPKNRFPELRKIGETKFEAKSIGCPKNTAFAVVGTRGEEAINDDQYARLIAVLELNLPEPKSKASLWEPS